MLMLGSFGPQTLAYEYRLGIQGPSAHLCGGMAPLSPMNFEVGASGSVVLPIVGEVKRGRALPPESLGT